MSISATVSLRRQSPAPGPGDQVPEMSLHAAGGNGLKDARHG